MPVVSGRKEIISLWAKSASGTPIDFHARTVGRGRRGHQPAPTRVTVGAQWQLVSVTLSQIDQNNDDFIIYTRIWTTGAQLLLDGAQLVDGTLTNSSWELPDFDGWAHYLSAAGSQGASGKDGDRVGVVQSPGAGHSLWQDHVFTLFLRPATLSRSGCARRMGCRSAAESCWERLGGLQRGVGGDELHRRPRRGR